MNAKAKKALEKLRDEIGGTIHDDGELYYGPSDAEIYISTKNGANFFLASLRTRGEDKGWYYASVAAEDVRAALNLSTTRSDPQLVYESLLQNYCLTHLSEIEPRLTLYRRG